MTEKINGRVSFDGRTLEVNMQPTDLYPNGNEIARFVGNFGGNEVLLIRKKPGRYYLVISGKFPSVIPGDNSCTPDPDYKGEKSYLFSHGFEAGDDETAIGKIPTMLIDWVECNEAYWHELRTKLLVDLVMKTNKEVD